MYNALRHLTLRIMLVSDVPALICPWLGTTEPPKGKDCCADVLHKRTSASSLFVKKKSDKTICLQIQCLPVRRKSSRSTFAHSTKKDCPNQKVGPTEVPSFEEHYLCFFFFIIKGNCIIQFARPSFDQHCRAECCSSVGVDLETYVKCMFCRYLTFT